jgi:predicted MPP superfamily phosphohydrolase
MAGAALALVLSLACLGSCALLDVAEFPAGGAAVRIVHLSDLHFTDNRPVYDELVETVNRQPADFLFCTGDLVESDAGLEIARSYLSRIRTGIHRFAVLGNHDSAASVDRAALARMYADCGFTLLVDEQTEVLVNGKRCQVIGMSSWETGDGTGPDSLDETADLRLVLAHEPIRFDLLPPHVQAVALFSGHTHGGQITFFGAPLLLPEGSGSYVAGKYNRGDDVLFVSRGVGNSIVDLRLFAQSQIGVIGL